MQLFWLVANTLLEECPNNMLKNTGRMPKAMLTSKLEQNQFQQIRRKMLSCPNKFLNDRERNAPGFGLRLSYSEMCSDSFVLVLFSENETPTML